ncbi:MAG: DNA polymerase III subunit beta [Fimbriimonadaceae bacterium]|nr:DNA polymerase III subunit beta [Fimbriimonadaceae bacterium]
MKFVTRRDDLQQAISTVQRAVSSRSTLPILSNILLEAESERLTLSATDLEIGIRAVLPVECEVTGGTTLQAKLLAEVVGAQSSGLPLVIEADDQNHLSFRCGRGQLEVHGLPAEEFPVIPAIQGEVQLSVPQAALKRMIQECIIAVGTDETRARLTGMLLLVENSRMRLVATDTHRLATASCELASERDISVIIPARALREVERQLSDDEQATVAVDVTETQVQFRFEKVTILSRLIEGEFPNYRKAIPATHEWSITGPVSVLRESVRRCAIVSREDNRKLKVQVAASGELRLEAQSTRVGSAEETVDEVTVVANDSSAPPLEVAFNADYLLDILNQLGSDEFKMQLTAANQPAAIRPNADQDYVYVLMPMQLG